MSRIVQFRLAGREIHESTASDFRYQDPGEGSFYWFDLSPSDPDLPTLLEQLGIPSLKEDFQTEDLTPHLEEREESLTLFLPWIQQLAEMQSTPAVSRCLLYLTRRYFLSLSEDPQPILQHLRQNFRKEFPHAESPGFLLFLYLEESMSRWANDLSRFEDEADQIEQSIHEHFSPEANQEIFHLKKRVLLARKHLAAERDILMRVSGKKMAVITDSGRRFLGDLYTHANNLSSTVEMVREILAFSHDSYMSVLSRRMNEVMKVLTIFATVVLPISLIPAIYGMNFRWMPGLQSPHGFWLSLGAMGLLGIALVGYFRRKGWL